MARLWGGAPCAARTTRAGMVRRGLCTGGPSAIRSLAPEAQFWSLARRAAWRPAATAAQRRKLPATPVADQACRNAGIGRSPGT